MFNIY